MKILHVITGLNSGGAEGVLYRLCTGDPPGDDKHIVISMMGRGIYADRLEQHGVIVYCLNMPRGRLTIGSLLRLYRIIKRSKPDVIQTWMYHANLIGGIVARLAGVRTVVWGIRRANMDPAKSSRTTMLVSTISAKLSSFLPKKIISCSIKATQTHQALGYQADKFVTIPNGYALDILQPNGSARIDLRNELGIQANAFVLGMVARFDVQKDHANLLRALALLRANTSDNFVCLLVGQGMTSSDKALTDLIDQGRLHDHVMLLGQRNDIPSVMNALDLHVLSSLGEGFPNVLAEAMACGTPCATTDVGDAALIVGKFGWVVPPRDSHALFGAIRAAESKFRSDPAGWETLRVSCRKHIVANFELSQMIKSYRDVWLKFSP